MLLAGAATAGAAPADAQEGGSERRAFTIGWVGDMALSKRNGLPPRKRVFRPVRRELSRTSLLTGNLEGTLGRGGPNKCRGGGGGCFAFQAPASWARVFRGAGFRLVNLGNNHSRDFGESGLRQTRRALRRARIAYTGLRGQVRIRKVNGVRVAFLGFAPYPWTGSLIDIRAARRQVAAASERAKVVVVFMHAGAEGVRARHVPRGRERGPGGENRGRTRDFAHAVVSAGADAVLGSAPHVLRGIECYRGKPIAYSLGNFVGYRTLRTGGLLSLSGVLRLRLDSTGRFRSGRLMPVRLTSSGLPRPDRRGESIGLVRRLSRQDFGRRRCLIAKSGRIAPRR